MLKRKLIKTEWEKLSEEMKKEYKAKGDDYVLDAEEDEDAVGELRRANERLKSEKAAEKKRADDAAGKLEGIDADTLRQKGDIVALEKSWKEKRDKDVQAVQDQLDGFKTHAKNSMIDAAVGKLVGELTEHTALLTPHLKGRFDVEFGGDNVPVLKVLSAEGKPSALGVEDLRKEVLANKDFASILTKSKASGGGASKSSQPANGSGGANPDANGKPTMLSDISPEAMVAHIKSKTQG